MCYRLECHIVGGFIDPRQESVKLSMEILGKGTPDDVLRNVVHFFGGKYGYDHFLCFCD